MRKLFLFLLVVLLNAIPSIAQKREDSEVFKIVKESTKLTYAKGWMKSDVKGNWVENNNVIASKKVSANIDKAKYFQNFEWMQVVKIVRGKEYYYVILYRVLGGYFEYYGYDILHGWKYRRNTHYSVITPSDYLIFKDKIESQHEEDFFLTPVIDGEAIGNNSLIESINSSINIKEKYGSGLIVSSRSPKFIFNSQQLEGDNIVRFRLAYDYFTKYREQGFNDYDLEENLNNSYFEVDKDAFLKILIK